MTTPATSTTAPMCRTYTIKALTDIWTGDADRKGDRLITTGLLGSIRWWFEVLVRGLGGSACDPSDPGNRCPQDSRKQPTDDGHHCVVCELFGCTGWARKFRFRVLDANGNVKSNQIRKGETVKFVFTALRPIAEEEWALLDLTLRLIADYGALGGRTVFKPSDEPGLADLGLDDFKEQKRQVVLQSRRGFPLQRNDVLLTVSDASICSLSDLQSAIQGKEHGEPVEVKFRRNNTTQTRTLWYGKRHHQDLGLIEITEFPQNPQITIEQVDQYLSSPRWRRVNHGDFAWASLKNFWCVKGRYLARQDANSSTFNQVIGREQQKNRSQQLRNNNTNVDRWLAGRQQESKKVFSFKDPPRTFGFVKRDLIDFNAMKSRLNGVWQNFQFKEFKEGPAILQSLLSHLGGTGGTP